MSAGIERYRRGVRAAVASSAGPYGYTLTIWTSGAILLDARGVPSTLDAFLFVLGALCGFGTAGLLAYGDPGASIAPRRRAFSLWKSFHLPAVGVSAGVAAIAAHLLASPAAWPVAGFAATLLDLLGVGLELSLGGGLGQPGEPGGGDAGERVRHEDGTR